jgi:hypothetical protein
MKFIVEMILVHFTDSHIIFTQNQINLIFIFLKMTINNIWSKDFENDSKTRRINYRTFSKESEVVLLKISNLVCCKSIK